MTDQTAAPAADFSEVVRWLSSLRVDVAETVGGVLLRGARPVQVGAGGTKQPATSPTSLVGYALRNTDPANPATVYLRDSFSGQGAGGDLVIPIQLTAGQCLSAWFGPGGLNLSRGLYVDIVTGAVEGAVYLRGAS